MKEEKILPLIEKSTTFNLIIPSQVEEKIRHLCSVVHDTEWSGVLFYKYKGTFEDGTFEAECLDICVMNVGNATYTTFDATSTDIIDYRVDNNLLEDGIAEGLIHSHAGMPTFFSGTDKNTLAKEGEDRNHFLSLIVNNAGEYSAAITRKVITKGTIKHIKSVTSEYDTFNGKVVVLGDNTTETKEEPFKEEVVEYFNLNIKKEDTNYKWYELDKRLSFLKKPKYSFSQKNIKVNTSEPKKIETSKVGNLFEDDYDYGWRFNNHENSHFIADKERELQQRDDIVLCLSEEFDRDLLDKIIAQLLTGSILINVDKFNFENWVSQIDKIYEKAFKGITSDNMRIREAAEERFAEWIDCMLEFLLYTEDSKLLKRLNSIDDALTYTTADTAMICAYNLYFDLNNRMPDSAIKDIILLEIHKYLPHGIEDYI